MLKRIQKHLSDNAGEGYIWFLSILIVILMLFAAIYNVIDTSIAAKNIRTEIDAAAEDVYGNIREAAYDSLIRGTTAYSFTSYSSGDIAELFARKIGADVSYSGLVPTVRKNSKQGQWMYSITDFSYAYIDNSPTATGTYHTYQVGDINRDGEINDDDLDLATEIYTTHVVPAGCFWLDLDINRDGNVTDKDLELLASIIEYYASYNQAAHYQTSVALLVISFRLEMPIKFANFDFGTTTEQFSYTSSLTVKPS